MDKYALHVKMTALPDKRAELADVMLGAAGLMSDAQGCEIYLVHLPNDDPDAIWITEVWDTKDAHDKSLSHPGVGELIAKARPMLAGMESTELTPLGGKGLGD